MTSLPNYHPEPPFITVKDALSSVMDEDRDKLEVWVSWAREHLVAQRMKLVRLEQELAGCHTLVEDNKKEKAELQEALTAIQTLNHLRKSVEVLEIGSRVNVVGEDITGTLESVILNKGSTLYVVRYWYGGEQRTAYLPPECVSPADMLLPPGKDHRNGTVLGQK